jgi:hypothetical protein
MRHRINGVIVGLLSLALSLSLARLTWAQTSTQTASALPRLVRFGGTVKDVDGSPLSGVVGITFALYSEQTGGAPLWLETQNVTADANGRYTVLLGSTKPDGLPAELFTSEQARWVGMQVSGQAEQPRVSLVSAPYALKSKDAETIGGLPPSAFVLAAPLANGSAAGTVANSTTAGVSPPAANDVTTTGGAANYLPLFNGTSTVIDSVLFQSGAGTTAKIGVNTATPVSTLDVKGGSTIRGILSLPTTGVATATAGNNSQPLSLTASAYKSSTPAAVNQVFRWQAEPAENDTATPSGTLNLLFGEGTAVPAETGLHIASNGQIRFAAGQTFPGAGGGSGTVTSVATGTGLKGGPITTSGTLTIDTTVVPRLDAANTFTGNQTVKGTLTANSSTNAIIGNSTGASSPAVVGAGNGYGILGTASAASGWGVEGFATAASGNNVGVYGLTASPAGYGVQGYNAAGSGGVGVYGNTGSTSGQGVQGFAAALTGTTYGVNGVSQSPAGYGVGGSNSAQTGNAVGVYGTTNSSVGYGVEGAANAPNGAAVYAANNSPTGNAFGLFASSASANGFGVEGTAPVGVYGVDSLGSGLGMLGQTSSGTGVQGQASSGAGVSGLSATGDGVYGQTYSGTGYGVVGENFATTGTAPGLYGASSSSSGYGVEGYSSNIGVYGDSTSTSSAGYGVEGDGTFVGVGGFSSNIGMWGSAGGEAISGEGVPYGVVGSSLAVGVYGTTHGFSSTGNNLGSFAGVWGDSGAESLGGGEGVLGTADSNLAVYAVNNDSTGGYPTMVVENETTETHNPVFQTSSPGTYSGSRHCTIDTSANLTCTGVLSGSIQGEAGKQTAVYAMQSAENWLEDAGSGQLSNGSARIELDPAFARTVNAGIDYHVFLTPKGDCKGLYVTNETATGFEVRELSGGTSSIAFDYRIMAKRKGYENVRLEDLTERFKQRAIAPHERRAPLRSPSLSKPQSVPTMATPPMHPLVAPRPVPVAPKLLPITPPRIAQAAKSAVPQAQK